MSAEQVLCGFSSTTVLLFSPDLVICIVTISEWHQACGLPQSAVIAVPETVIHTPSRQAGNAVSVPGHSTYTNLRTSHCDYIVLFQERHQTPSKRPQASSDVVCVCCKVVASSCAVMPSFSCFASSTMAAAVNGWLSS